MDCHDVAPLLTLCVDEEATAGERERVAAHLAACRACSARMAKEHAARRLIQVRGRALANPAPPALRARCAAIAARHQGPWTRPSWRTLGLAGAAAALLLAAVVGYGAATHSPTLFLAGLTIDHLKCFAFQNGRTVPADAEEVEGALERSYGWRVKVPASLSTEALTLIGARRCLSSEGTTAHVMYRHAGRAVSLYVLPEGAPRAAAVTSFAGYPARIWSRGTRTYVLVGSEGAAGIRRVTEYFRSTVN